MKNNVDFFAVSVASVLSDKMYYNCITILMTILNKQFFTDNSLPVLLSSWINGDKYAKD